MFAHVLRRFRSAPLVLGIALLAAACGSEARATAPPVQHDSRVSKLGCGSDANPCALEPIVVSHPRRG